MGWLDQSTRAFWCRLKMILTKSQPDEIQDYLSDASYVRGGHASGVIFPETGQEVAETLAGAAKDQTPVTVSGAGTGTVAGRVPFGGTKQTGNGHREAAIAAIDFFTEWKTVYIDYSDKLQRAQIDNA